MNQITEKMAPYSSLPEPAPDWALFLDVDGTLVEIAETPDAVIVPAGLAEQLGQISAALDGAVALVSGRSIASLEALLGSVPIAIAGLHGLEVRQAGEKQIQRARVDLPPLQAAREALQAFVDAHEGVTLEDKGLTLAVHYRAAPQAQSAVETKAAELAARHKGQIHAIRGKMVIELKPPGCDKGSAIEAFMAAPPFKGRVAVFAGDDITDEDGFAVVDRLGGISIRIGAHAGGSLARLRCASVADFGRWLTGIAEKLATKAGRDPS